MCTRAICDHTAGTFSSVQFNRDVASGTSNSFLVNGLGSFSPAARAVVQDPAHPILVREADGGGFLPENGHGVGGGGYLRPEQSCGFQKVG